MAQHQPAGQEKTRAPPRSSYASMARCRRGIAAGVTPSKFEQSRTGSQQGCTGERQAVVPLPTKVMRSDIRKLSPDPSECAQKGYPLVIVMAESFSVERRKLLRFLGAGAVQPAMAPPKRDVAAEDAAALHSLINDAREPIVVFGLEWCELTWSGRKSGRGAQGARPHRQPGADSPRHGSFAEVGAPPRDAS